MPRKAELKQQTASANTITITGEEYRAKKHLIIPFCFSLVIISFFFTFCDFKVVRYLQQSNYPVHEETQKSVTGFKFITGTSLPKSVLNNNFVPGVAGIENEPEQNLRNISYNIWAAFALAAAIGGIVRHGLSEKESEQHFYNTLLAASGVIALLLLMVSVQKYEDKIDVNFVSLQSKMIFQFPYWLALLSFAAAGLLSFLQLTLKSTVDTIAVSNKPTSIYVSIITQYADHPNQV